MLLCPQAEKPEKPRAQFSQSQELENKQLGGRWRGNCTAKATESEHLKKKKQKLCMGMITQDERANSSFPLSFRSSDP